MVAAAGSAVVLLVFYLVVIVLEVAALWRVFEKAGRPGWAAIVPIYNTYVIIKVAGRSGWWLLLCLIPFINLIAVAILMYDLARSFGRGGGFAIGLFLLSFVFVPILAWGSARYLGPAGT